jgi:hypothetical protein
MWFAPWAHAFSPDFTFGSARWEQSNAPTTASRQSREPVACPPLGVPLAVALKSREGCGLPPAQERSSAGTSGFRTDRA